MRRRDRTRAGIEHRVRDELASLRPLLPVHASELEMIEFDAANGLLTLRIDGSCTDCEMPAEALLRGIESHLQRRIPEVREVRTIAKAQRDG